MESVTPGAGSGPRGARRSRVKQRTGKQKQITGDQRWLRMWAVARYDLGLTSKEFFRLTPRQYDALLKRKEYATQRDEYMLAQIAAYTINFSMCRPKDAVDPFDLMPSMTGKERPAKQQEGRVRMTKKVRREVTENFRAGLAALRAVAARGGRLKVKNG